MKAGTSTKQPQENPSGALSNSERKRQMRIKALWVLAVLAGTLIWTAISSLSLNGDSNKMEVSYAKATAALDRMKDWSTWMTGLQTAVLASLGLLLRDKDGNIALPSKQRITAFLVLLFHGTSITLTTWILSSLPSIQLRLIEGPSKDNDIYCLNIFKTIPVRLGPLTGPAHFYCLCGFACFAWFVYVRAINASASPEVARREAAPE